MDFADTGSEAEEAFTEAAIQAARTRAAAKLSPTGMCQNPRCEDDTDKVFCGPECRDEYDAIQRRRRQ